MWISRPAWEALNARLDDSVPRSLYEAERKRADDYHERIMDLVDRLAPRVPEPVAPEPVEPLPLVVQMALDRVSEAGPEREVLVAEAWRMLRADPPMDAEAVATAIVAGVEVEI